MLRRPRGRNERLFRSGCQRSGWRFDFRSLHCSFLRFSALWRLGAFVVGVLAGQANAAITFVQVNLAVPQSPQSTVSVTYTAAQTAGNLNVVAVGWNDTTAVVSSVTDSRGNVYTRAIGPTVELGS